MSNNTTSNGIGIFSVLGIVFIVLKLTKTIDWSWWYVLMPFYGPLLLLLVIIACIGLFVLITAGITKIFPSELDKELKKKRSKK
jgi:hypothetical protein